MTREKLLLLKRLILTDTNFKQIQQSMKINGLTWMFDHQEEQVPTGKELQNYASELLDLVIEKASTVGSSGYYIKGGGGFVASYYAEHFPARELADTLSLTFSISNISLSYDDVVGTNATNVTSSALEQRIKQMSNELLDLRSEVQRLRDKVKDLRTTGEISIHHLSD